MSHWSTLYTCDFFTVETLGTFETVRHMVFFVIELKTRIVHIAGIRVARAEAWMIESLATFAIQQMGSFPALEP